MAFPDKGAFPGNSILDSQLQERKIRRK